MTDVEKIRKQAEKDAMRFMEAKMDYGRGSGNKRKIVNAEIQERLKNDIYRLAFEKAIEVIDQKDVIDRIKTKKHMAKAYDGAKKTYRAARRAENFYSRNRGWINDILSAIFER